MYRISKIATPLQIPGNDLLYPVITYTWAVLYFVFRVVVGPICAIYVTQELLCTKQGRKNVPIAVSIVWLTMCWAVLLGSIPWIVSALDIVRYIVKGE